CLAARKTMLFVIAVVYVYLASVVGVTDSTPDSWYVAAVYEHKVILNLDPRVPVSRHDALQHMQKNLDIYEEQAARAAQQVYPGVPEDGIHGFNFTRLSITSYLETIPDPQEESWNPCMEPERHNNTEHHRLNTAVMFFFLDQHHGLLSQCL
uniref:Uncharacterized protein n=1 Tax=Astatotilapia calliptera TaxID=8154 RepID=A0A3P8NIZ8_ASTCA